MYGCDRCGKTVGPNIREHQTPSIIRNKRYPFRPKANRFIDPKKPGKRRVIVTDDPGGSGFETVKAIRLCPQCAISAKPPGLE